MKSGVYLVIDTEFCGPSPEKNGIIQLAAAALDNQLEIISHFVTDVCPPNGFEALDWNLQFAGFSLERVLAGVTYHQLVHQLTDFVSTHFDQLPIVVAQFYPADFMHLNHLFTHVGMNREMWNSVLGNDFIDTKSLANQYNAIARMNGLDIPFPVTSLSKPHGLSQTLGITDYQAHDAYGDVVATAHVLKKLLHFGYNHTFPHDK